MCRFKLLTIKKDNIESRYTRGTENLKSMEACVGMGLYEMFELGFVTALWDWSNESVTLFAYICFAVGLIIQIILEIKGRNSKWKWLFIVISGINMVLCELILLGD